MSKSKPVRVLMVCLGNICRSPMAEAAFRDIVDKEKLSLLVDSAGTSALHKGENYHRETRRVCLKHNLPMQGLSRPVTFEDLRDFDYIIAMDESNLADLKKLDPTGDFHQKLFLFRDYASGKWKGDLNVPDPYYGGPEGFDQMHELLVNCAAGLLKKIRKDLLTAANTSRL